MFDWSIDKSKTTQPIFIILLYKWIQKQEKENLAQNTSYHELGKTIVIICVINISWTMYALI